MRKAARRYEEWLTEDGLTCIRGWAREGLTDDQIAHNMGISRKTLYNWKRTHLPILHALKKGKTVVDFEVESALLRKALSGDVRACMFWLNNRKRDKWCNHPDSEPAASEAENNLVEVLKEGLRRLEQQDDESYCYEQDGGLTWD